jgi:hypothetical protein
LRTESTRASTQAGQLQQIDVGLFTNWINAYAADNQRLVEFYQQRFREEFKPAFEPGWQQSQLRTRMRHPHRFPCPSIALAWRRRLIASSWRLSRPLMKVGLPTNRAMTIS